jgi:hypothetical protein
MSPMIHIILPATGIERVSKILERLPEDGLTLHFVVKPGTMADVELTLSPFAEKATFDVIDSNTFLDMRFGRNSSRSKSHAMLSSTQLLTDSLLEGVEEIFLDLRYGKGARTRSPKASLITSMFQTQEFIKAFLINSLNLRDYPSICNHYFFFSQASPLERTALLNHQSHNENIVLIWNKTDPGLYACWNKGIEFCDTEYVSNANVDDFRHREHLSTLVNLLDNNSQSAVAATAVIPFYSYRNSIEDIPDTEVWYADQAGFFVFGDLARLENTADGPRLDPHNLPHCMPVWRRSLHEEYGFFDESTYGTFADWAFWLKITSAGEYGVLDPSPYTYYFVNIASHNRRGNKLEQLHKRIETEFLPAFEQINNSKPNSIEKPEWPAQPTFTRKLDLNGTVAVYGQHRNSFSRLIEALNPLGKETGGVRFIPFIEKYFVWGEDTGEAKSATPFPLDTPWIGILHVPFDAPTWFDPEISPEVIFETELWQRSLQFCRGIICLSEDMRRDLSLNLPEVPNVALFHPTELSVSPFDPNAFMDNKRLVQAGDWLRKLNAISAIDVGGAEKVRLLKNSSENYIKTERAKFGYTPSGIVNDTYFIENDAYDQMLSSSVVLCLMYATSANNLILECIARGTPIIVNPLPAAVEYLGADYPLFAEDVVEAGQKFKDEELILTAHTYLRNLPTRNRLDYQSFLSSLASSSFYENLKSPI